MCHLDFTGNWNRNLISSVSTLVEFPLRTISDHPLRCRLRYLRPFIYFKSSFHYKSSFPELNWVRGFLSEEQIFFLVISNL